LHRHNMTTHTAALPTSLITKHPTAISNINCVVSTEQPCSQYSKHSYCHVTYSILNAVTWTSHRCSQCSVSNLRYMFWHSAVSPSHLFTIQLWKTLLRWHFPSFITVCWLMYTSVLISIKILIRQTDTILTLSLFCVFHLLPLHPHLF